MAGCKTLADVFQRVEKATSGHLEMGVADRSKLFVRDTQVRANMEPQSGRLSATGVGESGIVIARKLGLFLERGTDQSTLVGTGIPNPRWELDGENIKLSDSGLFVEGDAAEALGIGIDGGEGDSVSGENIVENKLRSWLVIGLLAAMAPFMAMLITIFQAGNRRFTTSRARGAGFNLWYLFMNVGAAGGGFLIDIIYLRMGLPHYHVFTFGLITGVLCLLATFFLVRNTDQLRTSEEIETDKKKEESGKEKKESLGPIQIVKAVFSEPVFWRFTALITLLLGVRAVFLYLGLLFPKFWYRVIGADAQVGLMQAFNPVLVIIGLILVIPLLQKFNVYKMLVFGALITSISMLIPAIPPLAGIGIVEWTYIMTGLFLLVLTVGELIWSPRLSEYTAAIAPEGQEGTYLGLSMVPYFLAKLVVSGLSGSMLARWCPEYPPGEPNMGERIAAGEVP
ncbi:MAG: MFS transporter, partial [Planctomycetota bacterium]|nr:MFS transporter [Planctomycetota bacterium]